MFVKNLNFKTTDESLKQHFSAKLKSGSLKSATVWIIGRDMTYEVHLAAHCFIYFLCLSLGEEAC